jgi:hypothetical protein
MSLSYFQQLKHILLFLCIGVMIHCGGVTATYIDEEKQADIHVDNSTEDNNSDIDESFDQSTWYFEDANSEDDCPEDDAISWYADSDQDGYGDPNTMQMACTRPDGYLVDNTDCNDANSDEYPDQNWYLDNDGDGYGSISSLQVVCNQPEGYTNNSLDCDDEDSSFSLSFNGLDHDCDYDSTTLYIDYTDTFLYLEDGSYIGYATRIIDDINGDGIADLMIPNSGHDLSSDVTNSGAVYIIYGPIENSEDSIEEMADVVILGEASSDETGFPSHFGDANGDGLSDVFLLAPYDSLSEEYGIRPALYLVHGSESMDSEISLENADAKIWGDEEEGHYLAWSIAVSDFNADGLDDIVIADHVAGSSYEGKVYIFYAPFEGDIYTSEADVTITGLSTVDDDYLGYFVQSLGDTNNDDHADLLLSSLNSDSQYIFLGSDLLAGNYTVSDANTTLVADSSLEYDEFAFTQVGDVNGDGYDDVFVVLVDERNDSSFFGQAVLFYGPLSPGDINYTDADVTLNPDTDQSILDVNHIGDFNNDGYSDFVVTGTNDGDDVLYIVFGSSDLNGEYIIGEIASEHIYGESLDIDFISSYTGGDINADGYSDFVVRTYDVYVEEMHGEYGGIHILYGYDINE